jgi:galactokinase
VFGSRLSGGGFGGSAILLVNMDHLDKVLKDLTEKYSGTKFEVSFVLPSDGAIVIRA